MATFSWVICKVLKLRFSTHTRWCFCCSIIGESVFVMAIITISYKIATTLTISSSNNQINYSHASLTTKTTIEAKGMRKSYLERSCSTLILNMCNKHSTGHCTSNTIRTHRKGSRSFCTMIDNAIITSYCTTAVRPTEPAGPVI